MEGSADIFSQGGGELFFCGVRRPDPSHAVACNSHPKR